MTLIKTLKLYDFVSDMNTALISTFCDTDINNSNKHKFVDINVKPNEITNNLYEKRFKETCWPKSCWCEGVISKNKDCNEICIEVCKHRFNLQRWICTTFNNSYYVSINALCDGVIDCIDESDEMNCHYNTTGINLYCIYNEFNADYIK